MTITMNFHNPERAESTSHASHNRPFDAVSVYDAGGGYVAMFLPIGSGQAVADAINAAIAPKAAPDAQADEVAA